MKRLSAFSECIDAPLSARADPVPPDLERRPPYRHMRQCPRLNLLSVALMALLASLRETHACDITWDTNSVNINYPS